MLDPASDSEIIGDGITSDNTPTITGIGEPGDTITVVIGGQALTTTVGQDGTWSVTPTMLADGLYSAVVTATDPAGNTSAPVTVPVTVDTVAPSAPVVEIVTDANNDALLSAAEQGTASTDAVKVTLPAGMAAGSTITVFSNAGAPKTIVLTAADITAGFITTTVAKPAEGATLTVSAIATDLAGNTGLAGSDSAKLDTTAPAVSAVLDPLSDSGAASDGITSDATPTISGAGVAGDTITVVIGGQTLATTVAGDGTWSVTPTVLADGSYSASVTATDPAGNVSTPTSVTVEIDTTASSAPTAALPAASDSGVSGDGLTSDATPTISGTGTAGDTITVVIDSQTLTTTVAGDGSWSVTAAALTDGSYTASVTATDPAGNVSAPTSLTIEVDTTASVAPGAVLNAASDSGVASDDITNDSTPTISGTGVAGDTITVVIGGQTLTTTVAGDGTWSVTAAALTDGSYNASVTATDPAGNVSTATSVTLTVDATAPAAPTAALAAASDSGVAGDDITSDATPTISGTGVAGDTITVVIGSQTLTTTVAGDGTWSVTAAALTDGSYTASVTATDPAGNVSATTSVSVTVDTTPVNGGVKVGHWAA